jgi:two-component system, NtrC family, sensor histidine kinase GlrK
MTSMRWAAPKSLNGMLLLGLGAVAVPLLAAVLYATTEIRQLHRASEGLVTDSVQTTRLAGDMFRQIAALKLSAGLYQVMKKPEQLVNWRNNDEQLHNTVEQLKAAAAEGEALPLLQEFASTQVQLRGEVADGTITDFTALSDLASRVAVALNNDIASKLNDLRDRTLVAQQRLFWGALLLVPLVLGATLVFSIGIGRPLRQIDSAIAALGAGNFSKSIGVTGPSDLQKLGAQLEWLRQRQLELAQERNRFLRHMSHELKTPLANIREGTELLTDGAVGELDTGQREVVTILKDNGIKLQRLIENLLSFSAWQSNSLRLELSEFRLRPLVRQVLENQQLTLVSQRVRLDVQVEELTLHADRGKLRLILENLLSNAIKYSPRGGVIHVIAAADGDRLRLEVADAGHGIPPSERSHVFDAFHTGRAPGGHVKGTGIGLSVVNEFVNVHNGSIEIVDGVYPGAHFRIHIPLRSPAAADSGGEAHAA